MSAPISQQPTLVAERVNNAASYMEMTIPLLHEARSAESYLVNNSAGQTPWVHPPPI